MGAFKLAVIGSGPAGLSAAARAATRGMTHILLEKSDHLSDTIHRYQRRKHIMATPTQLALRSPLGFEADSREKILSRWEDGAKSAKVNVRFNSEVVGVSGAKGAFTITLKDGASVEAEAIVLAIGTQGNPNRLTCEGAGLPHVQYQLDDPTEYIDERIFVIGGGDAGIENALGLVADPAQGNLVTLVNRTAEFATAKEPNVQALMEAEKAGRLSVVLSAVTAKIEPQWITLDTPEGSNRLRCDRIIARLGSNAPRRFMESLGIGFTSPAREAFPQLSPKYESTTPGIYVIGALAGYPLIKHCLNQGYDVIEYIAGVTDLKPADEPLLIDKLKGLPGQRSVEEWIDFLRAHVGILSDLSPLQMREFLLDSEVRAYRAGQIVFERNAVGATLFGIASGSVHVEDGRRPPRIVAAIPTGSIFGEIALISGRRRGATIRAAEVSILIEIPRRAMLKLMSQSQAAREAVDRITTERQILQIFGSGLQASDIAEIVATARLEPVEPNKTIIVEGDTDDDLFIIRSGSMVVERRIGGKPVFHAYVPAGSYVGEVALVKGGPRTATVRAAIRSEVIRLKGDAFRDLLARNPQLMAKIQTDMASRLKVNDYIATRKDRMSGALEMYSRAATFLVSEGLGEATDVLLIDETLCIGCDNCERACADVHDGLSRLDREAGRTFAHLHVPTSCRHCERPECMKDCPPNAILRGADGEVTINDSCIGCGNCQRNCPYGVIRMESAPPKKPDLVSWLLFGQGPGPGEPDKAWSKAHRKPGDEPVKVAIKCDMCAGKNGGPACVRACPTGAAIRVSPESVLGLALMDRKRG